MSGEDYVEGFLEGVDKAKEKTKVPAKVTASKGQPRCFLGCGRAVKETFASCRRCERKLGAEVTRPTGS